MLPICGTAAAPTSPSTRAGEDQLTEAGKEMKALEKYSSLTSLELDRYNKLRATTAELEEKIAQATERQKAAKASNNVRSVRPSS